MISDVVSLNHTEKVKDVYEKLISCKHNGFPIIDEERQVIGLISRNYLFEIIRNNYTQSTEASSANTINEAEAVNNTLDRESGEQLRQEGMRRPSVFANSKFKWEVFTENFHSSIKDITLLHD
jgi:predicted transcriptional regulator